MRRVRGLFGAVRATANAWHKEHSHLTARSQNLCIVTRAAHHFCRLHAAFLRRAREQRSHLRVHGHRWLLLQRANREVESSLLRDRPAQRANALLERAPAAQIGMSEIYRED